MVTLQGSTRFLCTPEEEEAWLKRSAEEIRKISLDTEIELLKPGSGRFTMDFCTLGMFIIGMRGRSESPMLMPSRAN